MVDKYVTKDFCKEMHSANKEDIIELKKNLDILANNHFAHIQESVQKIQIDMAHLSQKVDTINKLMWIVVTATVSIIFKLIFNI